MVFLFCLVFFCLVGFFAGGGVVVVGGVVVHFTGIQLLLPCISSSHDFMVLGRTGKHEKGISYCCFPTLHSPVSCILVLVSSHNIRSDFLTASRNSSFRPQIPYQQNR